MPHTLVRKYVYVYLYEKPYPLLIGCGLGGMVGEAEREQGLECKIRRDSLF